MSISGDKSPYIFTWAWTETVGTLAATYKIKLTVNNTLRGYETVSVGVPVGMLVNEEGHSFMERKEFNATLNQQANPEMAKEIQES